MTNGATPLSAEIDQFNGYQTYHYRVIAKNSFGVTYGQDETFIAPDAPKPGIENTQTVSVTPTTATVSHRNQPQPLGDYLPFRVGRNAQLREEPPFSEPIGGFDNEDDPVSERNHRPDPGGHLPSSRRRGQLQGHDQRRRRDLRHPGRAADRLEPLRSVGKTTAHLGGLVAAVASPTAVSFQYGTTDCLRPEHPAARSARNAIPQEVGRTSAAWRPAPPTTSGSRRRTGSARPTGRTRHSRPWRNRRPRSPTADCDKLSRKAKKQEEKAQAAAQQGEQGQGQAGQALRTKAKKAVEAGEEAEQGSQRM